MVTPFAVTRRHEGEGVSRLVLTGDLDEDTSKSLIGLIIDIAEQEDVSEIVVDVRRVRLLAAAGVRALLRGREAAAEMGRRFRVVNATGIVYQVLRISGVHKTLAVTVESDVAAR